MKKPRAGGEIDAYCTKCRLDLNHRIVAMVGDAVKQVECLTCRGTHSYRRPRSEIAAAAEKKLSAKAAGTAAPKSGRPGSRETIAARAAREQKYTWEKSIAGQPSSPFRAYRTFEPFSPGHLFRHSTFGDGVIARVTSR